MAEFFDISTWSEMPWYQTGGTRSKVIVVNPSDNSEYYFKTSLKRELKDYKYEYWSEIIASEIGSLLGFDTLRYDIAFNRGEMGCISKSMVTKGVNKLNEGISYLTGYDTTYNPEDKKSKEQYSFQLICNSLKYFKLSHYIEKIIDIIIFDSIIGNGDRHQENWGIITEYDEVVRFLETIGHKGYIKSIFSAIGISSKTRKEVTDIFLKEYHLQLPGKFSLIYDSGSCLGRELEGDKLKKMLTDSSMFEAYIRRGDSEIHWNGEKINHFELIRNIAKEYPNEVNKTIHDVRDRYDESLMKQCVNTIDLKLPDQLKEQELPEERKELIKKIIALRVQKLFKLAE